MLATLAPLLNSWIKLPLLVSKTLTSVPFSEAVAILVPLRFKARQLNDVSCASTAKSDFSISSRFTI